MAVQASGVKLTIAQAGTFARQAGFTSDKLVNVVSIAMAESGLNTHAYNPTDPYGGSWGVLQINGSHKGDRFGPGGRYVVSENSMFEPNLAFLFGWELSKYGADFSPWSTYTSGAYTKFVSQVRSALAQSGPVAITQPFPPYTGQPWYDFPIATDKGYGSPPSTYWNTDVELPPDIPITAPLAGKLTYGGYFDWGGAWTIKVDKPALNSGYKDYFVIHLDALNPELKVGDHVDEGTLLGWSGGETSLQDPGLKPLPPGVNHHVTLPSHSTGPHLDIGVTNSDTGSLIDTAFRGAQEGKAASDALVILAKQGMFPYGTNMPYPTGAGGVNTDLASPNGVGTDPQQPPTFGPSPLLTGDQTLGQAIHNTLVQYPGFYGIADAIDQACQFPGFINETGSIGQISFPDNLSPIGQIPGAVMQSVADTIVWNSIPLLVRTTLIFLGVFLVMALLWQMVKPNMEALGDLIKLGVMAV